MVYVVVSARDTPPNFKLLVDTLTAVDEHLVHVAVADVHPCRGCMDMLTYLLIYV